MAFARAARVSTAVRTPAALPRVSVRYASTDKLTWVGITNQNNIGMFSRTASSLTLLVLINPR